MSNIANKLFDKIIADDANINLAFGKAVQSKLNDALEVRKISLTSDIYNNLEKEGNGNDND